MFAEEIEKRITLSNANPPWKLIPTVLEKIKTEGIRMMMVIPEWTFAQWYADWQSLCEKSILLTDPVYLTAEGQLRKKPWWHTRIGILNGNRLA